MADYINREKLLEHIKDVPTWEIDDKGVHDTKYPKGMFDCEEYRKRPRRRCTPGYPVQGLQALERY